MIVHILASGSPLCGFMPKSTPKDWPTEHRWTPLNEAQKVTCKPCREAHYGALRKAAVISLEVRFARKIPRLVYSDDDNDTNEFVPSPRVKRVTETVIDETAALECPWKEGMPVVLPKMEPGDPQVAQVTLRSGTRYAQKIVTLSTTDPTEIHHTLNDQKAVCDNPGADAAE